MTDRDDQRSTDDEQHFELGEILDSLKRPGRNADDAAVSGGQARMNWRSVTDEVEEAPVVEPPAPAPAPSSFQFDLGSALQRLGGPPADGAADNGAEPPTASPLPTRDPAAHADPLPTRTPAARVDAAPIPVPVREPTVQPDPVQARDSVVQPEPLPTREPAAQPEPLPTREPAAQPEPLPTREPAAQPEPLPTREPAAHAEPLPTREPAAHAEPAPEPLPTRRPATPAAAAPAPTAEPSRSQETATPPDADRHAPAAANQDESMRRPGGSAASVFDDARPAPTLPMGTPTLPAAAAAAPVAPSISPADAAKLPSLPAPAPAAPPVIEPLATATAATDINAVRSVQMRAKRDEHRSKMFGRTFLALVVLAAAVGGALVFGRGLLFPTQWDAGLTAAVDAVQEGRDAEFPSTVPLRVTPDAEYAGLAIETWFGPDWPTRYADWRALGLASGDPESESVVAAVVAWRPAFYDPVTDTVYRAESAGDEAAAPALRLALEEVFERQSGATPPAIDQPAVGVLSAGSESARNARAIDRALLVGAAPTFTLDGTGAPLPLLVEMGVVDLLGDELVATAEAAGESVTFGEAYPQAALTATDVDARQTLGTVLPPDVEPAGDPVALGTDQWALVLDNRLPDDTVDRLTSIIVADTYRPVVRAGTRCFVGQFHATDAETATELLGGLTRWAIAAPATAAASATQLTPITVELFACDPGASTEIALDRIAVDRAIARMAPTPAG